MEVFTTMITPYTAEGDVDYDTARRFVDWYFESGIDGIFAVCQSSKIFYLTLEERVALNKLVFTRAKELERLHGRRAWLARLYRNGSALPVKRQISYEPLRHPHRG